MKEVGKVSKGSLEAYLTTFGYLVSFFNNRFINELSVSDFEDFQKYLKDGKRGNKTINKHINYLRGFVKFACDRKLIGEDNTKAILALDEKQDEKKRKKEVENYTNKEINDILNFEYDDEIYNKVFKICAFSGMRISEIYNLQDKNIKCDNGVYYFDIEDSKTISGIRDVPIHSDLVDMIKDTKFPLLNISENAFKKRMRDRLYKVVDKDSTKNVHTLRATFIDRAITKSIETNANITLIVQEIVGHSKSGKVSLTIDRYAKGFDLKMKQNIVNSVEY